MKECSHKIQQTMKTVFFLWPFVYKLVSYMVVNQIKIISQSLGNIWGAVSLDLAGSITSTFFFFYTFARHWHLQQQLHPPLESHKSNLAYQRAYKNCTGRDDTLNLVPRWVVSVMRLLVKHSTKDSWASWEFRLRDALDSGLLYSDTRRELSTASR